MRMKVFYDFVIKLFGDSRSVPQFERHCVLEDTLEAMLAVSQNDGKISAILIIFQCYLNFIKSH